MNVNNYFIKFLLYQNNDWISFGKSLFKIDSITNEEFISQLILLAEQTPVIHINKKFFDDIYMLSQTYIKGMPIVIYNLFQDQPFINMLQNKLFMFIENVVNYYEITDNKQYAEIVPWIRDFCLLHWKLDLIENAVTENLHQMFWSNYLLKKTKVKCIKFFSIVIDEIPTKDIMKQSVFHVLISEKYLFEKLLSIGFTTVRLDFTSSGIQLISYLINDKKLMTFSDIRKDDSINQEKTSYNYILNVLITNYNKEKDYLYINSLLNCFDNDIIKTYIKDKIIFSKKTIKDKTMLEGYKGTLFGFVNKIKLRFKRSISYNLIHISNEDKYYSLLHKMCFALAQELDKIFRELFPAMKNTYVKLTSNIVKYSSYEDHDGILVEYPHIAFLLAPSKYKTIQLKINSFNIEKKKLARNSRRNVSFFTDELDKRKLNSSLGANIIHGLDSLQLYYTKEILRLFTPEIRITVLHDAYIFGDMFANNFHDNFDINIMFDDIQKMFNNSKKLVSPAHSDLFRDILRIATYLTFRKNIINDIFIQNQVKEKYIKDFPTVFSTIKPRKFEEVFQSKLLDYLFTNRQFWIIDKPSFKVLRKAFEYFNKSERQRYNLFISKIMFKNPGLYHIHDSNIFAIETILNDKLKEDKKLLEVKQWVIKLFFYTICQEIIEDFYHNFFSNKPDALLVELRAIITNDNFAKF